MTEAQIAQGLIETASKHPVAVDVGTLAYLVMGALAVWLGIRDQRRRNVDKTCAAVLEPILRSIEAAADSHERAAAVDDAAGRQALAVMAKGQEEQTHLLRQILAAIVGNGGAL